MNWFTSMVTIFVVTMVIVAIIIIVQSNKRDKVAQSAIEESGGTITKRIGNLFLDEQRGWWTVSGGGYRVYGYSEILDFEIVENGEKYKSQGGIIRSVIGGVTFGAVGAIVGATTANKVKNVNSMYINVIVNDANCPNVIIKLLEAPTTAGSFSYNLAVQIGQQTAAQLAYMMNVSKNSIATSNLQTIDTKVVGVTKNNDEGQLIQSILATLNSSDSLTFVREPNNPYDSNAIKVICEYQHIGYIKSDLAKNIAPLMDSGKTLSGHITAITGGIDGLNYGCNIHIEICA